MDENYLILCIGRRNICLRGRRQLKKILIHLSVYQVGHFLPTKNYLKMDSGGEIDAQTLEFQKIEEVFEDRDSEVFDTLLTFGSINQLKTKIKTFEHQGTSLHGVCRSHFHFFLSGTHPKFSRFC